MNRTCVQCGSEKYFCKGLCKNCYNKQFVPSRWSEKSDSCARCGTSEIPHVAHGLCRKCYRWLDTDILCACGCGLPVPKVGNKVKKFRQGHWLKAQREGSDFRKAHIEAMSGENNPQYGKFGKNHPAYGHETKPEVREQRRQTRLKALNRRTNKMTDIEKVLSEILDEIEVSHVSQKILCEKFAVDEFLPEYNLVIEAYGGYWHGDPRIFNNLSTIQAGNKKKDASKKKYLEKCGYNFLVFWERELKENRDWCKKEILLRIENSPIPFV